MRHVVAIAEPIEGPQVGGRSEFVGERPARMPPQQVEGFDQPRGAALVPQLCVAEDGLTQADFRFIECGHGRNILARSKVGGAMFVLRSGLPPCSAEYSDCKNDKRPSPPHRLITNQLDSAITNVDHKTLCNNYYGTCGQN